VTAVAEALEVAIVDGVQGLTVLEGAGSMKGSG
jgi:hypothetical protein